MNVPGTPPIWILVCGGAFFSALLLPYGIGWILFPWVALAAMFAAVITAYQEAARFRAAGRRAGEEPAGDRPE